MTLARAGRRGESTSRAPASTPSSSRTRRASASWRRSTWPSRPAPSAPRRLRRAPGTTRTRPNSKTRRRSTACRSRSALPRRRRACWISSAPALLSTRWPDRRAPRRTRETAATWAGSRRERCRRCSTTPASRWGTTRSLAWSPRPTAITCSRCWAGAPPAAADPHRRRDQDRRLRPRAGALRKSSDQPPSTPRAPSLIWFVYPHPPPWRASRAWRLI